MDGLEPMKRLWNMLESNYNSLSRSDVSYRPYFYFDMLEQSALENQRRICKSAPELDENCLAMLRKACIFYRSGKFDAARRLCFEVGRAFPNSHLPYLILAKIAENSDTTELKSHLVRASELYKHNPSVWCRLAELEIEYGAEHNAIVMYSKAIRADLRDKSLHLKRIELAVKLAGNHSHHQVLMYKKRMAECLPESDSKDIIQICMEVVRTLCEKKAYYKAINVLYIPFKRIPEEVPQDLVDMMLWLHYLTDQFLECASFIVEYLGFTVDSGSPDPASPPAVSYKAPSNADIGVKMMFIVCLAKLKLFDSAKSLIDEALVEGNVEKYGYAYLEVAKAMTEADLPRPATKLLFLLSKSKTHSIPNAVWLEYLECVARHQNVRTGLATEDCFPGTAKEPERTEFIHYSGKEMCLSRYNFLPEFPDLPT